MTVPAIRVALVADPHVSLADAPHSNIRLIDTVSITTAIIDDLERRRPDLAIWMGDLTHDGSPAVRRCFRDMVRRVTVPRLWMLGNHDVERVTKQAFADEVVPCVSRMGMKVAGWNVAILDTVTELSPGNPMGCWHDADLRLLSAAADSAGGGPLLVLAHHPPRDRYMEMGAFWRAVAGFRGTGVFIGGHSHRDLYSRERGWHLVDVSSCCRPPLGYHLLEISPRGLGIRTVAVDARLTGPAPKDWAPDAPVFPLSIPVVPGKPGASGATRRQD